MILRLFLSLAAFAAIVGGLGFFKYQQIQAGIAMGAAFAPPPEAVTAAEVREEPWQDTLATVGEFVPVQGVTVAAEEEGKVTAILFESGNPVAQGDVLVRVDTAVEEAQLKSAVARSENALIQLRRLQALEGTGALAQKELDDADAEWRQATAEGERLRAIIERKSIRAPFAGTTGIRQVQLGQYLAKGDPIVGLQSLSPIHFNFNLPQQRLSLVRQGQAIELLVDAYPGETFAAAITAINPQINEVTRSVQIQATVDNRDQRLRPGMFAHVNVLLGAAAPRLTIPATAVQRAPFGDSVFVIETLQHPDGSEYLGVRQQFVKVGPSRGDQVAILEGLKPGEKVATSGLFKLRPNAAIIVDDSIQPANSPTPTPEDS
jgi:membrane fusion protein (multidrug efflux system)